MPLKNEKAELSLTLLKMMLDKSLSVLRLDVTAAFAPSLGKREVVVVLEENGFSKYLRLTPRTLPRSSATIWSSAKRLPETQVIDLRIPQLAFLEKLASS